MPKSCRLFNIIRIWRNLCDKL